jgi:hypothetical protein
MALKWIEGFESYGVTNGNNVVGLQNKYLSASADSNFQVQPGRLAGKSIIMGGNAVFTTPAFTSQQKWTCGFAYKQDQISATWASWRLQDGSTVQIELELNKNGEFKVYRGANEVSLLGITNGVNMRGGIWTYIEVQVVVHNTAGSVVVRCNGTQVLSLTNVNTRSSANNTADRVTWVGNINANNHSYLDDIYVCDDQGSNNITFLGPQKVTLILPTGDNGTNQWSATGTGTTHADRVKENPHDSSTTYVSDSTSGHVEEWDYANTGSEVTSIKGVQVNTVFETDDANAFSVKTHAKSGGTSSDDAGTAGTNGTYKTAPFLLENDPNTAALWTKTNLDAALFGVKTV